MQINERRKHSVPNHWTISLQRFVTDGVVHGPGRAVLPLHVDRCCELKTSVIQKRWNFTDEFQTESYQKKRSNGEVSSVALNVERAHTNDSVTGNVFAEPGSLVPFVSTGVASI